MPEPPFQRGDLVTLVLSASDHYRTHRDCLFETVAEAVLGGQRVYDIRCVTCASELPRVRTYSKVYGGYLRLHTARVAPYVAVGGRRLYFDA